MSPSRTIHSGCKRSTNFKNRDRLILPTGKRRVRILAGAMGERGSIAIYTSGGSGETCNGRLIVKETSLRHYRSATSKHAAVSSRSRVLEAWC
jgi:hypothetical protein